MGGIEYFVIGMTVMFALMLLHVPIGFAMMLVGFCGYATLVGFTPAASTLMTSVASNVSSFSLAVVPLFILMGSFASLAGLSDDLYRLAERMIGHRRGGLAQATILGCAVFGAICGSSLATAATFGRVALPEMEKRGYATSLASGTIAAGGTLGALIPPSIILVIYAVMTESFILDLFVAALIPALMAIICQFVAIYITLWRDPSLAPAGRRYSTAERIATAKSALPSIGFLVIILGGMYGGVFTVNEAAAAGAIGAMLLAIARGKLTVHTLRSTLIEAGRNTGMIYLIILGADMLGYFVTITGAPEAFVSFIQTAGYAPIVVITCFVLMYIVLGSIFDTIAAMLITLPFVLPVVESLGYSVIWWGIVTLAVIELGMITPPIGMNVFVLHAVAPHVPMSKIFRGVMPFILTDLVRIVLLVSFPVLALWLLQ
ncbi:TRAP transporter large permease [Chelatococcus asaccharovorans]|uniref:TRAP transporter large permease protein n=1 Tax=Chelatococcus asaccharovorans TaxID=28210 RepID=A0A2V3TW07_9HYPH|nr:TRAP transporter large permease [Chelatococcus asaccharovorans]MBS7705161.1 TRAP transporter large permease [Chelatococcus asaccharovorans]PXW53658.1 tripartite ATP-independent transporter DctM subunit [Chelatococcus asaccharovorans]